MDRPKKKQNNSNTIKAILVGVLTLILIALLLLTWKLHTVLNGKPSGTKPIETTAPAGTTTQTETSTVDTTVPTEPSATDTEPEQPEDQPVIETEPEPEINAPEAGSITYEAYLALDTQTQQAYYSNFASPDDFFKWFDSAKAAYDASTEPIPTFGDDNQENPSESTDGQTESKAPENEDDFMFEEGGEDWE